MPDFTFQDSKEICRRWAAIDNQLVRAICLVIESMIFESGELVDVTDIC